MQIYSLVNTILLVGLRRFFLGGGQLTSVIYWVTKSNITSKQEQSTHTWIFLVASHLGGEKKKEKRKKKQKQVLIKWWSCYFLVWIDIFWRRHKLYNLNLLSRQGLSPLHWCLHFPLFAVSYQCWSIWNVKHLCSKRILVLYIEN